MARRHIPVKLRHRRESERVGGQGGGKLGAHRDGMGTGCDQAREHIGRLDAGGQQLQTLLGRATIETVINSPCDCQVYFPSQPLDGYGYKEAPLMHLLPKDQGLFVRANVPFGKLADVSRIHIACAFTVDTDKGEILVDYEGSSGASPYGINVVRNYTHAYTTFAVRAVLNPDLPNNYGSLAPILVEAPVGSIVNAVSPQPCTARHVVGMFLPNALLKALAQIRPMQAMAEGAGADFRLKHPQLHNFPA